MKFQIRTGALLLLLAAGTTTRAATLSIEQQAYLKASNTGGGSVFVPGDYFGGSVAVSGATVVVGAIWEDSNATGVNGSQENNNATNSGAVYVFVRNGTNWGQQAYLKASNTGARDNFGWSVAISDDTIVVGAPRESSNSTGVNGFQNNNFAADSGAAYVFMPSGTNWNQQAYLKASNTEANDAFGRSVGVSGDTVVVGAPLERSNATGVNGDQSANSAQWSGAVYVFVRGGTKWSQQAYLKASNTGADDRFGESVAISENTVVVGAFLEDSDAVGVDGNQNDNSATNSGAAYVFVRTGTNWSQQAYLKASNTGADDVFAQKVAVSGNTIVVGSPGEDSNATGVNGDQSDDSAMDSGAAYIFVRNGTNWNQQAYLKASNTGSFGYFGESVAVSDDMVIAGATGDKSSAAGVNGDQSDTGAIGSGAAYCFWRSGATWNQQGYLKASNTGSGDAFGNSVAVSGYTMVVGAVGEDSDATGVNAIGSDPDINYNPGAAYAFATVAQALRLSVEQSVGGVRVSWPLSAVGSVLEEVNDLNALPVTGWSAVPAASYQTNITDISVTVQIPTGKKFYRLSKP